MNARDSDAGRGFDDQRQSQVRIGQRLTPAERLRWLEETMDGMRRWLGRACQPPRSGDPPES